MATNLKPILQALNGDGRLTKDTVEKVRKMRRAASIGANKIIREKKLCDAIKTLTHNREPDDRKDLGGNAWTCRVGELHLEWRDRSRDADYLVAQGEVTYLRIMNGVLKAFQYGDWIDVVREAAEEVWDEQEQEKLAGELEELLEELSGLTPLEDLPEEIQEKVRAELDMPF